jgi:hypothetical protein
MSAIPRVTELTRERIAREFDDLGPEACIAEIIKELRQENPELLDMATKWATDVDDPMKMMVGFGMFYRLLIAQSAMLGKPLLINPLPRVTGETREKIVAEIDEKGSEAFTLESVEELEESNPQLLQMAHQFAARHANYIGVMQGFALLYRSMVLQSLEDRARLH